jgi:tryptophanyl-tRNA synthetase
MAKIFSGIRPSGKLHLGNYLGAIKNWIELQNGADPRSAGGFGEAKQCVFAVVDLHGITTPYDPKTYQEQINDVVLDYLAAGVNSDKALLIRQSQVPEHTELAWLFNTITPVSWLDRLPTYREQLEKKGMIFSGVNPERNLVEIMELPIKDNATPGGKGHPFFAGTHFHPEFKSRPLEPHPLFREFIHASIKNRG